MTRYWWL